MTEGLKFVIGGAFVVGAYANQLIDYVQTVKALDRGYKEIGLLASKVVAKWGKGALPVFTFASAGVITGLTALFGTYGGEYLMAYSIPLFAVLTGNNVKNYLRFKK